MGTDILPSRAMAIMHLLRATWMKSHGSIPPASFHAKICRVVHDNAPFYLHFAKQSMAAPTTREQKNSTETHQQVISGTKKP